MRAAGRYGPRPVLSGGRRPVLRPGDRATRPRRTRPAVRDSMAAGDHRKTLRPRLCIGRGSQRADPQSLVRGPDLPHRSFPRQRNRPEHFGAALRQRHLRAAVEPRSYRPRSDYGRRDRRRRGPRPLLRKDRRDTPVERLPPNILMLRIQPDEGLSLSFSAKRPGADIEIDGVQMDFAYRDYFAPLASVGYETLIYDCLIGDATLFQRADAVEAGLRAVPGLIHALGQSPAEEFPHYAA